MEQLLRIQINFLGPVRIQVDDQVCEANDLNPCSGARK